jgi:predicted metal-dependent peptidase
MAQRTQETQTKECEMTTATIDMKKLTTKLAKAKTALILEHPFVGTIALSMPFEFDESIRTAATNGKRIKFNPEFVDSLTDEEVKFLVAHECFHPMLEHNFRRGERQGKRWNMAADYVINKLLTDESIGRMPKMGLLDANIYNAGHGTSEGIYNILPEQDESGGSGAGEPGGPLDDCEDGDGSPAEQQQQQAEWKVKVAQAAQAAKMMGKMSANMQRLVDEVLQPRVDWREVLQKFLVKARTDQRSFARFNRRFIAQGLYLPSVSGEQMGEVCFAVDCSGSIDQKTVNQFAAEIKRVKEDLMPERIHVLYFDSEVSHVESYEQHDDLDIKPHGGGGTDFAPVFTKIIELGINPVAVVFLTDLCCNSFGDQPDAPVLWVTTDPGKAPFGEVVEME